MPLPHTVGNALVAGGAASPAESHLARTYRTSNSCGKTARLRFSDALCPAVLIRRFARKRSHTIDKQVSTHQTDARHRHTIGTQCASHRTDTRGRYVDTRNQYMRNIRKTGVPTQRRATARQPVGALRIGPRVVLPCSRNWHNVGTPRTDPAQPDRQCLLCAARLFVTRAS